MSGSTYFLSDLHIGAPDGPRTESLLAFLRGLDDAEAIYLVGDVFDFWLGYRHAVFSAVFPLLRALADLVDRGVRVSLFSGNHDPDPGRFFSEQLGVAVHEGPLEIELGGRRVRMEHGDVVDPRGWARRAVCTVARTRGVRALARLVHPDWAWTASTWYARRHGDRSDDYGHVLPPAFFDAYLPEHAARGVDVVVLGHYHRAVHHRAEHAGRPVALFALGDWVEQRTYLRHAAGAFTLMRHRVDGPDTPLAEGDHAPGEGAEPAQPPAQDHIG